ncbi:MAG TPA: nitrate- and nitrite sensing domain-containing protein [Streptosporangiaceae bacterium]
MPSRKKASAATPQSGSQPWNMAQATTPPPSPSPLGPPNGGSGTPEGADASAMARRDSRRRLRDWRVRSRLLLLIVIPTASALVLGGLSIASSAGNALAYQRVETLATLGQHITVLAQALEDERDRMVVFISSSPTAGGREAFLSGQAANSDAQLAVIADAKSATNRAALAVTAMARKIGSSYPPQARQAARLALTALASLPSLRSVATGTKLPALVVTQQYTAIIDDVLALNSQIAQSANDPALAQSVQVLGLVTAMQEVASQQRALLVGALLKGGFGPGELTVMQAALSAQQSDLASFNIAASVSQQQIWNDSINKSFAYQANADEVQAISLQERMGSLKGVQITPIDWYGAMSNSVDIQMGSVEHSLTDSIIARAQVLRRNAIIAAVVIGAGVLLVLLLALILTMVIGRSMVRPLRRLRAGALDVAGVRLPETVRRMSESDGEGVPPEVEPIDVDSLDEIGEVARAFDQVHREALRLASNEAALRGNVNAMFVNLSRRSQSLVERQIRLIDELEQGEQDSERLGSLFQMDHLATRMRRNSENLLVLAGHDSSRRWSQPVPLVDVLRAAISEIEQYERVMLNVQPGISVRGPAVNDVVHLIAELAENATSFSSADTPVSVSGHLLSSGGVLLDITDQGVGMGSEEMAHANWRLDNPPVVDVAVSRRMGLFVVARLAARHGVRVRLRPGGGAGLTALVWLPDEVVAREGAAGRPSGPIRGQEPDRRIAIGSGAQSAANRVGPAFADNSSAAWAAGSREWSEPGQSVAEQIAASRASKFAPTPEGRDSQLGPQRIPGAGPHPGSFVPTATGPQPVVGPEPAFSDSAGAGQESGAGVPREPMWSSSGLFESSAPRPEAPAEHSEPIQRSAPAAVQASGPASESSDAAMAGDAAPQSVLGAPVAQLRSPGSKFRSQDALFGSSSGEVIVPPASLLGGENRLPIFEAVESDWFRRGRPSLQPASSPSERASGQGWSSPGDAGWRAAEAAVVPSSSGVTVAGLPRRVPKANLIPGTATAEAPASPPVRSAAATRDRFASLQRGMREGRAATGSDKEEGTDDVPGGG